MSRTGTVSGKGTPSFPGETTISSLGMGTTFGLPDLRERSPIGQGRGPGLTDRREGQRGGAATVTLTTAQLPAHTHPAATRSATTNRSTGAVPARGGLYTDSAPDGPADAHENRPPYLGVNYIIALVGTYPSRD